jgi:uncharacterized membrane protein YeaQ/YmgE (transglycosylase-associated protein family)
VRRHLPALLTAFAFLSPSLAAQQLSATLFAQAALPALAPAYSTDDFDTGKAAFAGILGTVAGLAAGGFMGHQFDRQPCDDCYALGILGAFVGATVGSPLAIHLSNGRRGRLGPAVLASFGIGLVGSFAATGAIHDARILLALPILQTASAIDIERRTAE